MNKQKILNEAIKIINDSYDHYSYSINPNKLLEWYSSISEQEKESLVETIIENFNDARFIDLIINIKSKKIYNHCLNMLDKLITDKQFDKIKLYYFSVLSKYEEKNDLSLLLNIVKNKTFICFNESIKWRPFEILCDKYPDLIEEYIIKFKEIYHERNGWILVHPYESLIKLYKNTFPIFFKEKIATYLTEEEVKTVFDKLPYIFSSGKYDDIKEEVYMSLEKLFNRSISREIKA